MDTISNRIFFNNVSEFYDTMLNFESSLDRKVHNLKNFISPDIKTAADIGCGSGIDSIALSSLGLNVTGFDSSEKMIEKSYENSERLNKKINFYNYSAQDIPSTFNSKFDFICSLGNTIANISPKDLTKTIKKFSELLNKNGKLLFHILNYEKIIHDNERIVNINKGKENYLIRFYDFEKDFINFNILKFAITNPKQRSLISTKLYPHKLERLLELVKINNLNNPEIFQDLKKTKFNIKTSQDIYIFCSK